MVAPRGQGRANRGAASIPSITDTGAAAGDRPEEPPRRLAGRTALGGRSSPAERRKRQGGGPVRFARRPRDPGPSGGARPRLGALWPGLRTGRGISAIGVASVPRPAPRATTPGHWGLAALARSARR